MSLKNKGILILIGITILLFDIGFNYLRGDDIGKYDMFLLIFGSSLVIFELIPKNIRIYLNNCSIVSKYSLLLLSILTLFGFYFRIDNLGNLSFWVDELFTVHAAIGLLNHGIPVLPSGEIYNRAMFNTILIALSFKFFGISEFSARIISVIFGTLTIPLVYLIGVKFENKRVGILAAILITFSVWEVVWSREARMYSQFQFFYLLTLYFFYIGLNRNNVKIVSLSAITFLGAFMLHKLALAFLLVAVVYILLFKREILYNRYLISAILLFSIFFSAYLLLYKGISIDYFFSETPQWGEKSLGYYANLPEIMFLLYIVLIGVLASVILRIFGYKPNLNHYLLLNFFLPFVLLSLYSWKTHRYALFIFPILVLSASNIIDIYVVQNFINDRVVKNLSSKIKLNYEFLWSIKLLFLIVLFSLLLIHFSISTEDAVYISKKDHGTVYNGIIHSNWKEGCKYVESRYNEGDKVITTLPLATMYYMDRADYRIKSMELTSTSTLTDWYSGVPVLNNLSTFLRTVENNKGWVIVGYKIDRYYTDPEIREYIRNNMTFHPEGSDETIEVYSWN